MVHLYCSSHKWSEGNGQGEQVGQVRMRWPTVNLDSIHSASPNPHFVMLQCIPK